MYRRLLICMSYAVFVFVACMGRSVITCRGLKLSKTLHVGNDARVAEYLGRASVIADSSDKSTACNLMFLVSDPLIISNRLAKSRPA